MLEPAMKDTKSGFIRILDQERGRFARYVRSRIFRISTMDVEDIVSDVIFGLIRRADVVGEVENLMAYVYRALENKIIDFRRRTRDIVPLEEDIEGRLGPGETVTSGVETPENTVSRIEMQQRLIGALGQISAEERAVWIATEIEGMSFSTLAEEWGNPIGTLLSRKSRANRKLREILSEHYKPV